MARENKTSDELAVVGRDGQINKKALSRVLSDLLNTLVGKILMIIAASITTYLASVSGAKDTVKEEVKPVAQELAKTGVEAEATYKLVPPRVEALEKRVQLLEKSNEILQRHWTRQRGRGRATPVAGAVPAVQVMPNPKPFPKTVEEAAKLVKNGGPPPPPVPKAPDAATP